MTLTGKAVAYGAVTIVNAISCGLGAAVGINLKTEAKVILKKEPRSITGLILSDPKENPILIKKVVKKVLEFFHLEKKYGAYVETNSSIPIARGLKSSSLAVLAALKKDLDDLSIIKLGVDAAVDAKVTITGAFDDACASYFGDVVITNNKNKEILKQYSVDDYSVLIYTPSKKFYTAKSDLSKMKVIANEAKILHKIAEKGNYWSAMTLNGLLYSAALGFDMKIAIAALSLGALAAGLSGKGPAIAAIVSNDKVDKIKKIWKKDGVQVISARINHEKAHVL
jgi:shikimate kinase